MQLGRDTSSYDCRRTVCLFSIHGFARISPNLSSPNQAITRRAEAGTDGTGRTGVDKWSNCSHAESNWHGGAARCVNYRLLCTSLAENSWPGIYQDSCAGSAGGSLTQKDVELLTI